MKLCCFDLLTDIRTSRAAPSQLKSIVSQIIYIVFVLLIEAGHRDGDEVPDDQLDPEALVHLEVVGVRGSDEEDDCGEQGECGVEDPLVLHLHYSAWLQDDCLDEPG